MPPFQKQVIASYWDRYPTPPEQPPIESRADSPLDKQIGTLQNAPFPPEEPTQDERAKAALPVRHQAAKRTEKTQELRFFNVTDPKELKDRGQLRLNRQHVMQTFLEKERQKPQGQRDIRVDGAGAAIKRKRSRIQMPDIPFTTGRKTRHADPDARRKDLLTPPDSLCRYSTAAEVHETQPEGEKRPRPTTQSTSQDHQLVKGINRTWPDSRYIQTSWQDIPFLPSRDAATQDAPSNNSIISPETTVGATLNPFNTWPAFSTSEIDINRLKWSCSQRFGSEGITWYWVPELLRARHAFLSTICISSAHDDIMSRASKPNPPPWLSTREGVERLRVRSEVIGLVNRSLGDPELRVADATIISVLHLLNSEVMGCDDRVMKTHQDGLHRMVRQRGGLEGLGVQGQLARILTITMYMIAVLRESPPHGEFVRYASKHNQHFTTTASRRNPESPIYSHLSGFRTITAESCPSIETWDLLNTLREVTTHFLLLHSHPTASDHFYQKTHATALQDLHRQIFALPKSDDPGHSFPDLHSRSIYEALRLAALLYAEALVTRSPFSVASKTVSAHPTNGAKQSLAHHLQLRRVLLQTDLSSLWGPLAGVLFFITLVGGAGANPGPLAQEQRIGQVEDGRKFLAAVAVRCSIVLSFEHGGVVLEMLRRFVAVESILNSQEGDAQDCSGHEHCEAGAEKRVPETWKQGLWMSEPGIGTCVDGLEVAGPELSSMLQRQPHGRRGDWTQMADFARDFECT